ncbi:DUF6478 family protein [Paracoccus sp. 2205BS29-5]|uniref:DUF6478 family protein n=2 Tax=Paracoccus spongiarum TaxID=3064387 RepID=A0ABT9JBA1_9RHOB|nr:DUF6478 family protein [Paracoccus sp. 2205BS29-5]MDP5306900.1 DUF6478 family protein [Paracoccus sp. 2205BS29-5]
MALRRNGWLARLVREAAASQWDAEAEALARGRRMAAPELCDEAAALQRSVTRFLQLSDARLPRHAAPVELTDLPPGTDWHWRPLLLCGRIAPSTLAEPDSGQRLGEELVLFHDCPNRALILKQDRNRRATDQTPYGLTLEVMGFAGGYLALSLDLPDGVNAGLSRNHILRLDVTLHAERPIVVYGRLNVAQGPNTETMLRQLGDPVDGPDCRRSTEFDLGYAEMSSRPVDKVWLDLIFEAPYMNAIRLGDAVLSRHPRADM